LVELPAGFGYPPGTVARLNKAVYGLIQAARQWSKKKRSIMMDLGFLPSKVDPCLFVKKLENGTLIYVLVYVDDCVIIAPRSEAMKLIDELNNVIAIKFLGELLKYNGGEYTVDYAAGIIEVKQTALIDDLIEKRGYLKKTGLPSYAGATLSNANDDDEIIDVTEYRSLVGKALYINKVSRPDISNAVRQLSQHFDKPTLEHWKYLDKLISYLHSTKDIGLVMTRRGNDNDVMITGYCDSDYATEGDRKSISGYTVNLNGNTVTWKSKKQSCVTLSSTEAEYVAMSQCVTEMVFVRNLLRDMKINIVEPMVLF